MPTLAPSPRPTPARPPTSITPVGELLRRLIESISRSDDVRSIVLVAGQARREKDTLARDRPPPLSRLGELVQASCRAAVLNAEEPLIRNRFALVTALGVLGLCACGVTPTSQTREGTSELEIHFTSAPSEGSCLRITIDGPNRDVRSFDVTAGRGSAFSLGNVPTSKLRLWADAYPGACQHVASGAPASWFSESISVTVEPGAVTHVPLTMQHNDQPRVDVDPRRKPATQPNSVTPPAT